jgi:hypothetical protein
MKPTNFMRNIPSSIADFSAPDADVRETLTKVRRNLFLAGDPNWQRYTDRDILELAAPVARVMPYINQPRKTEAVREMNLAELMDIIQTRERFPGYRSEIQITPQMKDAILAKAKSNIQDNQSNYGKQPFTIVASYKGPDPAVPDSLAVSALGNARTVVPLPVTDFALNKNRNTIMNERYNNRHPVAFNSIVEPIGSLDSFAAFAEVATTTGTSNWLTGLLGVANTAAATYSTIKGSADQAKLARYQAEGNIAQANLQAQMIAARAEADRANKPNNTPLLIGGAVLAVVIIGFMMKK